MNELDLKTKIEGLEKAIKEHVDFADQYKLKLTDTKQELEDYYKPEMTPAMMDKIHNAVERTINDFDWEDADNYDKEFGIDYDGRVNLESINLTCTYDLVEKIVDEVCNLFKEADAPEDDNSQVNTQTVAEKIV